MINANPENYEEMQDLIAVLASCATLEAEKAFNLLEALIPKSNELIAATALLGKYQPYAQNFRHGEFILGGNGRNFAGFRGGNFYLGLDLSSFNSLAQKDTARSLKLADKFERTDVRIAAKLMILQSYLSEKNGGQVYSQTRLSF